LLYYVEGLVGVVDSRDIPGRISMFNTKFSACLCSCDKEGWVLYMSASMASSAFSASCMNWNATASMVAERARILISIGRANLQVWPHVA